MKKLLSFLIILSLSLTVYGDTRRTSGGSGIFDSLDANDGNITNVGDIALDNISADGGQFSIGGADKYVIAQTFTSAGINAAINVLGSEGGEVYLPEGDYDITATITIDQANTTLRGAGKGTRLLATNRFVYTTVTGTPAAGETLIGDTNSYTATVIQVDTTNKIVWYHTLSNTANYADGEVVSWSGGADTTISGAPTEQSFDVIDTNDKDYVTIDSICIYGGSGAGNSENLIGDSDVANYLTVKNCWLYESDNNGVLAGGDYIIIAYNYFEGMDFRLVNLNDAGLYSVIAGNLGYDSAAGIRVYNSDYSQVIGNSLKDITDTGIENASSAYAVVGNNTLDTCGFGITSSGTYGDITSNVVCNSRNGYQEIKITGNYNTISANTCKGNGVTDKGIYLDNADYCTVTGNHTFGHDVVGIQEDSDCQGNMIQDNNVQDTTDYILNGTLRNSPHQLNSFKYTVGHAVLTDADTSQDITLFTVPAGGRIIDAYAYVTTAFSGGSVSACTVAIGDTDPDGLAEEHDVLGTGNGVWILEGQNGTDKGDYLYDATVFMRAKVYTSATAIKAQFVSTTDNLVNLTAGSIDIYVLYSAAE